MYKDNLRKNESNRTYETKCKSICLIVYRYLRTKSKILRFIVGEGWSNILHTHALLKHYWVQILLFIHF